MSLATPITAAPARPSTLFEEITDDVLASFATVGGINNIDGLNLPSKRAVGRLCERLLQLIFPGFHDEEPMHSSQVREITKQRLAQIAADLRLEVDKSLSCGGQAGCSETTEGVVIALLQALPGIRKMLHTDVEAAYEGDPAARGFEEIIVAYPSVEAVAIQRLAHHLHRLELPLMPRIMTEWAHARTGIDIHPGASIGSHFFIDHGTGVVIGETCSIGSHVKLYHGVTLGARSFQKDSDGHIVKGGKRHPDVGDWVTIYPNSTILGGDTTIGSHTTIGGNVFLQHSVPANSLVYYEEKSLRILSKSDRATEFTDWVI